MLTNNMYLESIKDSVHASIQRLDDYIENHKKGLITAIKNDIEPTARRPTE